MRHVPVLLTKIIYYLLLICALLLSSCTAIPEPTIIVTTRPPEPTPEPTATATGPAASRTPASAAEVRKIAATFEAATKAKVEAWNSGDLNDIRALYTDDIVFDDPTTFDHRVGIADLMDMARLFLRDNPATRRRITNHFIGLKDSLATYDYWGVQVNNYEFTPDDPLLQVFLLELRGDLISSWTLLYGFATMEKTELRSKTLLDLTRSLLTSYASAWSSGDPNLVGALYAANSIREDTILGGYQEGSEAVRSSAESFFARYPGAQWTLLQAFGQGQGYQGALPLNGGTFTIKITDSVGQPCNVNAAVLLNISGGQIIHESLYYEPDSLIRCGLVR